MDQNTKSIHTGRTMSKMHKLKRRENGVTTTMCGLSCPSAHRERLQVDYNRNDKNVDCERCKKAKGGLVWR